ncbi:MAG: signal peptidase I [Acidimicrobiales bacterium]
MSQGTKSRVKVGGSSGFKGLGEWALIILGALLVAFVVKTFLVQAFYIPSLSMAPTLEVNDRVLVNKLSYDLHDVRRGDVIVFRSPESSETKDLIKRVVGLPGDTVESRDGHMVVNGRMLEEPYLRPSVTTGPMQSRVIPAHHYFMMGDNRGNSSDSRVFGPIDQSLIIGRAFVKVWPVTEIAVL